jgi:undecaprenyl-diphosphatase
MSPLRAATAAVLAIALAAAAPAARAGGGPLGIDSVWPKGDTGIWDRDVQKAVFYGLIVASWSGALIEGTGTRLGRTWWWAAESGLGAQVGAAAAKRIFQRKRPSDGEGPDEWFAGSEYQSFPSGEVSLATAVVAPFIAEYRSDAPAVWALAAIPAYVGVARMRSQAHWQTDVLGGIALGLASAWVTGLQDSPFVLRVFGDGAFVGLRYRW